MRRRASMIGLVLVLGSLGCRHRGGAWRTEIDTLEQPVVELLVVGQPRESHATRLVARELDERLGAAAAAERPVLVLWLGTDLGPPGPEHSGRCPNPTQLWSTPALAELARVVSRADELGASSWGLPGPDAWRCGQTGFEAAAAPLPYRQPGVAYVLRVAATGEVELVSRCEADRCEVEPPSFAPAVELVALDLSYWVFPELADAASTEAVLGQQRSLLEALAAQPDVPRLLISPIAVESAGTRGLGGRKQRTSFRYLPEFVQDAIAEGMFVGVVGALERDLQLSVDLSNAIIRGNRSFIDRPVFELVSGSAGGAGHTLPTSRGWSLLPDLWSEHPGFASLRIGASEVELGVHAHVAGRWRDARVRVPLEPAPLGPLRESPTIMPCSSCDPKAGSGDVETFVPRAKRPR